MHIENCPICSRLMCDLFVGIAPPVQHIQVNCFSLLLYSVVWPLSDMNFFSHISFDERVQCATGLLVCGIRNFKSSRISFFFLTFRNVYPTLHAKTMYYIYNLVFKSNLHRTWPSKRHHWCSESCGKCFTINISLILSK